jgi:predicted P-loop ATPase
MKSNDKDSLTMLSESIIINVDELEALNRKQIEEFKESVTKVSVRIRRPYARYPENMPRRASFCASLNSSEFLNDPTGSRRFLVHEVRSINNNHNLDIGQLYAHALHLYLNNEKYWFDRDEIIQINSMNKQFQLESLEEELLLNHFEPTIEDDDCMSASEILLYIQSREEGVKLQVIILGKMLAKNGFEKVSRKGRKKWLVKKR